MFKENCTQYCENCLKLQKALDKIEQEVIVKIWETCLEYKNPEHCEDNVYVLADKIMDIINPLRGRNNAR